MNSIGGVILEQLYCPPERPVGSPTDNNGGFFHLLRERVSHTFTDVFSTTGQREFTINDITSKNSELLDDMATAAP